MGTERHESRRIDNQLRGRAGRQGDPGTSRFYLSLEDDLMRIFAGDRVKGLMERMGLPDDEPIEHPWVTRSIGDAQSKVEARNFDIRKNLLEYDDVMNEQRKTVYKIRQQLLLGIYKPEIIDDDGKPTGKMRDIKMLPRLQDEVKQAITDMILHYGTEMPATGADGQPQEAPKRPEKLDDVKELFSLDSLRNDVYQFYGYRIDFKPSDAKKPKKVFARLIEEIPQSLTEQRERMFDLVDSIISAMVEECCPPKKPPEDWDSKGLRAGFLDHFGKKPEKFDHIQVAEDFAHELYKQAEKAMLAKEEELGTELFLRVFRHYYLEEIDRSWVEHLTNMEHLRDGIGLRGYGQRDPKQEYKKEGYDIFVDMMATVSSNVGTKVAKVQVRKETDVAQLEAADAARHAEREQQMIMRHGGEVDPGADQDEAPQAAPQGTASVRPQRVVQQPQRRESPKIGRNDPCPCGSGLKFKKCHGAALEDEAEPDAADDANA